MNTLIGQTLGKYQITGLLGRGGMADVYKAYHASLRRHVAIKILHSHLAEQADFAVRFAREATAIASLRHPHIVQVFDFEVQDGLTYMVMELIEGQSLASYLRTLPAGRMLPLLESLHIGAALASAIDYAHTQGMIHRDLKPGNVMLTPAGQVILTDFGIARLLYEPTQTASGALVGTPAYISPEQCRGERADARGDLYSLAVMLFELFTGHLPFESENPIGLLNHHLNTPPPFASQVNPALPPLVDRVLLRALSKDPAERQDTAGELICALSEAVGLAGSLPGLLAELPPPGTLIPGAATPPLGLITPPSPPLTFPLTPPTPPFQIPSEMARFVGRESILENIHAALTQGTPGIFCISGMGGMGKTTLAIHIAHALRQDFPDGVLWANAASSEPLAILDSWASAYGCDFRSLGDIETRAAALRGALADKRILVVLDDVRAVETIRPLLPGGKGCAVLLTTRNIEIATALNAKIYPLGALNEAESVQLMARILGDARVQAEAESAAEIVRLAGYLPLAVEIAAQRLSSRPRWRLADLAERLHNEKGRLDELKLSDREVRASFAISWAALDKTLRKTFACLAVFEGRSFTLDALAVVAGLDRRLADDHLASLAALSLVFDGAGDDLYRQHPLLADFAGEQLGSDKTPWERMARYFLGYAVEHGERYADLEKRWDHLWAGLQTAYRGELWDVVAGYADALTDAWFALGRYSEARQGYAWACAAARALGDQTALGRFLNRWGLACQEQSDLAEAQLHLLESHQIFDGLQDPAGMSAVQYALARVALDQGESGKALNWLRRARQLREAIQDQKGLAETYYIEARVCFRQGRYPEAEQWASQALTLQQEIQDQRGAMLSKALLAKTAYQVDQLAPASEWALAAFEISQEVGDKSNQAMILDILAHIAHRQGQYDLAETYTEKTLAVAKHTGDLATQAMAYHELSLIRDAQAKYSEALETGIVGLDISQQANDRLLTAFIKVHLGDLEKKAKNISIAIQHWQDALMIAQSLNHSQLMDLLENRIRDVDVKSAI